MIAPEMPSEPGPLRLRQSLLSQFRRHFPHSHADHNTGPSTDSGLADAVGADVDVAELIDHNAGTTGRARFRLSGEAALPPTVFVKLAPFDELQRQFVAAVGMGVAEA